MLSVDPDNTNVLSLLVAKHVIPSLWNLASSPKFKFFYKKKMKLNEKNIKDSGGLLSAIPDILRVEFAVFGSHTINEVSSEPDTIFLPSGVNCPIVTDDEWPANTFIQFPEGTIFF